MVAVESADGYLMPVTDKNEDKQLPREKEDKQAEPKEDTTKGKTTVQLAKNCQEQHCHFSFIIVFRRVR